MGAGRSAGHRWAIRLRNWAIACCTTYALASIAHSQYVVGKVVQMGVPVSVGERLAMTAGDLIGFSAYAMVIALGLAIGLAVMAGLVRLSGWSGRVLYPLAGLLTMSTVMASMALLFPITPIAAAREWSGVFWQCVAGLGGGWVYAALPGLATPSSATG